MAHQGPLYFSKNIFNLLQSLAGLRWTDIYILCNDRLFWNKPGQRQPITLRWQATASVWSGLHSWTEIWEQRHGPRKELKVLKYNTVTKIRYCLLLAFLTVLNLGTCSGWRRMNTSCNLPLQRLRQAVPTDQFLLRVLVVVVCLKSALQTYQYCFCNKYATHKAGLKHKIKINCKWSRPTDVCIAKDGLCKRHSITYYTLCPTCIFSGNNFPKTCHVNFI